MRGKIRTSRLVRSCTSIARQFDNRVTYNPRPGARQALCLAFVKILASPALCARPVRLHLLTD